MNDIVALPTCVLSLVVRLGAMVWVASSTGWCGFDSLSLVPNEIFLRADNWSAGDIRASLGQLFTIHLEAMVAWHSKYHLLAGTKVRAAQEELRGRGDEHKKFFSETGSLPRAYWLKGVDIKCIAVAWGVNIFVVSTEETKVVVVKYLYTVSSPGYVAIELDNMGMIGESRGESAVNDKLAP